MPRIDPIHTKLAAEISADELLKLFEFDNPAWEQQLQIPYHQHQYQRSVPSMYQPIYVSKYSPPPPLAVTNHVVVTPEQFFFELETGKTHHFALE